MPPHPKAAAAVGILTPESLSAAGRDAEKLSLLALQSKIKCDPEGYTAELLLFYRHFESSLHLFRHQSALSPSSDPSVSKEVGDLAMFLAHLTPFYPEKLADFPSQIADLLRSDARSLPSSLRCHLAQALILLINLKILDIEETLELFMDLQILGDRNLKKLAFSHVIYSIRRMNQKHKNEAKNRKLQDILFLMLQGEEEMRAKRSLVVLCDLHRRRVWFDDRTANVICKACFHTSSRILIAALSFLLGFERVEENFDSEASSNEDEATSQQPQVIISREDVYKAHKKGTASSKRKKTSKLQRAVRNMKRHQRIASEAHNFSYYSPLSHLKDAQTFSEKLFSRLQKCNERFEVRMMMLKVIARTVGLHRLILLNLYPFLRKYAQPHQRDVTDLLCAAIQACHDMVPPDAVEPLFKQVVNQFVHDRSRPEAIAVGLNVVREICLRMPLLINEDLLQDLVLYKKSHEKTVSTAARSLITLFREVKNDRGRPLDLNAKLKAYDEASVVRNVPDVKLLQNDDNYSSADDEDDFDEDSVDSLYDEDDDENEDEDEEDDDEDLNINEDIQKVGDRETSKTLKRKFTDLIGQSNTDSSSLQALKRLAVSKMEEKSSETTDGILSNEDFRRIRELQAKKEAMSGYKIPSSEQLRMKRLGLSILKVNIKRKLTKDERLAMVREGRKDRVKYQARAAVKKKKTGGLSNKQKQHKKLMPLAAKRSQIAHSRQEKKKKQKRSGKQFVGRKAWK